MQQQDVQGSHDRRPPGAATMPVAGPAAEQGDWLGDLRRTVLNRVLPRLSDRGREAPEPHRPDAAPHAAEVERFCDLALVADPSGLLARADELRAAGVGVEALVERVMAPAARRLGDLWSADLASFLDVTAALGRLQGLLRALGPAFDAGAPASGRRVLLAPAPGEQHLFGLSVVAAFFRRAGWDVTFEPRASFEGLLAMVRAEPYAVVGLSVAGDRFVGALAGQIAALRGASLAPDVVVIAGGPAFGADPSLRASLGVDAVAADAEEAVRVAEALAGRAAAARAAS